MNPRDKHMLEVFQDLGEGRPAEGVAAAKEPAAAEPQPAASADPQPSQAPRRSPWAAAARRLVADVPSRSILAALCIAAFALGLALGRGLAPEATVQAGEAGVHASDVDPLAFLDDGPPLEEREGGPEPRPASAPGERAPEGTAADPEARFEAAGAALAAPEHRYTVVAITYDLSDDNRDLAWATAYHFQDLGLPVSPPYARGKLIYILVGAGRTAGELEGLRDRVRAQVDPAGRRSQYESAYISPIDAVLSER